MAISSMWLFWGAILTLGGYYGTTLTSSSSTNTKDLTQGVWLTSKLVDISLNFLVFVALGWALSFGKDDGLMFAGSSQFFINGVSEEAGGMSLVFFTFALTNLPVVVVTEQIRLYTAPLNAPYHLATLCFGTCAFPVLLHSLWADDGWASAYRSTDKRALLLGCGALDTGGASVLHLAGGVAAVVFSALAASETFGSTNRSPSISRTHRIRNFAESSPSHNSTSGPYGNSNGSGSGVVNVVQGKGKETGTGVTSEQGPRLRELGSKDQSSSISAATCAENTVNKNSEVTNTNTNTNTNTKKVRLIREHEHRQADAARKKDLSYQVAGTLLHWAGTYGVAIVSNLPTDPSAESVCISKRVINVTIAASCACLASFISHKAGVPLGGAEEAWLQRLSLSRDRVEEEKKSTRGSALYGRGEELRRDLDENPYQDLTNSKIGDLQGTLQTQAHCGSVLCALVAISAGCSVISPVGAAVVGVGSAIARRFGVYLCDHITRMNVRNPEQHDKYRNALKDSSATTSGAVDVHIAGGLWGLLSVGLLASRTEYTDTFDTLWSDQDVYWDATVGGGTGLGVNVFGSRWTTHDASTAADTVDFSSSGDRSGSCQGVFYGGDGSQLAANLVYALFVLVWIGGLTMALVLVLKWAYPKEFPGYSREGRDGSANTNTTTNTKAKSGDIDGYSDGDIKYGDGNRPRLGMSLKSDGLLAYEIQNEVEREHESSQEKKKKKRALALLMQEKKDQVEREGNGAGGGAEAGVREGRKSIFKGQGHEGSRRGEKDDDGSFHFWKEFGYSWDAVIVLPVHPDLLDENTVDMIERREAWERRGGLANIKSLESMVTGQIDADSRDMMEFVKPVTCRNELPSASVLVSLIREAGLETYQYYSADNSTIIVKVRAPLKALRKQADLLKKPFLLDEETVRNRAAAGFEGSYNGKFVRIRPFTIYDGFDEGVTTMRPYECMYGRWEADVGLDMYKNCAEEELDHEFGSIQRLRVINSMVRSAIDDNEDISFKFDELLDEDNGAVLGWFPLHNKPQIEKLVNDVFNLNVMPGQEPHNAVRNYLGEEIGLYVNIQYFKFLNHYIRWLAPMAILGVGATVHLLYNWGMTGSFLVAMNYSESTPVFAVCVCIWTAIMLDAWLKTEKMASLRWGTTEYEETERELPSYKGEIKTSYINGLPMKVVDSKQQIQRYRVSNLAIATLAAFVVIVIILCFYFKFWLILHNMADLTFLADALNAASILLLDKVFKKIALKMTAYENCRTQTEFNDSLITKLFVFGFCNHYLPSIYIAFGKKAFNDPCLGDSCMGELGQTMFIIFSAKSLVGHFQKYFGPRVTLWYHWLFTEPAMRKIHSASTEEENENEIMGEDTGSNDKNVGSSNTMCRIEMQFLRAEYADVFSDYNEMSVQFGFLSLFVVAFPLAPALALISNFVEVRTDGLKLLKAMRRPWPTPGEDIGSWYDIFKFVSFLAPFINGAIIAYTMDLFDQQSYTYRLWVFLFFVFICFAGRVLVMRYLVSDSRAEEAEIQLLRQTHLVNKLIEKVPDDLTYENDDKHTQSARYYDESNVRRTQFADPARFYVHRFDDSAN